MPKTAMHALIWSLERGIYELREQEGKGVHPLLQGDGEQWLVWLATHTSFSFQGKYGHLNLLKEARKSGGEGYWYAYRRQGKRIVKKYVGRSADLSMAHLEATAQALTSEPPPASQEPARVQNAATQLPAPQVGAQLLAPKLRPPRLHASLVPRTRLFDRLDAGLERKLTLLSAPAGFGKTTLLRQWLAARMASASEERQFPPLAWLSLDAGDNDPVRFWRYVISACQAFQADLGQSALALLHTAQQPPFEPAPLETVLTAFLNELSQRAHSGMLVLEDYHTISSPQVHKTLAFFVEHLPATLHVLIMTRADPPLPLALLRVRNELCEVHAADLRFSHEETQSFLQQAVPSTLSEEAIRQLNAHLEGWAAGLRLLALALQERTNPRELERFLATFAGSHRPLQEYFVGEVLSTQPEPLQDFLLRTSVLSRLTGSLCNAITGRDDSEQLLEALDRGNLFLEPLDESGQWYRYHALFAESMQQEARRRLGVEALRALSHTASLWYEQYDLLAEAVEASLQAQDMARSAELIEQIIGTQHMGFVAQRVNEIQEFHTLRRWLEQLPEALLRQHPALCLSYATVLLFIFASTRVTPITRIQLEELLQMAEQGFRTAGNTAGLGEVFAFRALLARQQGAIIQAVTYARQALAWLPADELAWRSVSLSAEGQEALLKGRLDLARQKLLEALTLCEIMGNHGFTRVNTGMLSQISFEQGELHRSSGYLRQMLAEAREEGDRDDIAHAQLGLAQLSYEWNDLQAAERQAQEAFDLGRQFANEEFQVQATLILARVEHAQGETGPALQRLASLLSRLPPRRSPLLSQLAREVLSTQARLQLELGDLAAARRWAASRDQYDEELTLTQQEQEELLVVRLQISQGETQDALDALERWLTTAQEAGRARSALEVQVLMALAHAALKQGQEARQRLQAALSLAQTEGYQRLFLDEGETLATLLRGILAQTREKPLIAYLQTLLRAFASERARAGAQLPPEPASLVEPLSPQEHRVLRLLAAGRSNPEIARELVVSVNTIRTQVQSIYHKLNVNNRVAASEVARNLRLL